MLQSAMAQETGGAFRYEVLVVDNNSTDDTRAVVESFIRQGHTNLRYIFEGKQGKSHALNTGLTFVNGWCYVIADDDFILPPTWAKSVVEGFHAYPDASFVSGKVLPHWQAPIPGWMTPEHWAALALADYGDEFFYADSNRQVCLLACGFRRAHVSAVGGYRSELGVSGTAIGGVEDLDILQRLWKAGHRGVYLPTLSFRHKVPAARLEKSYHRRWHTGHGRFYAALQDADFERSVATVFGVPAHFYRQAALDLLRWVVLAMRGRPARAFTYEMKVRFFAGFWMERRRQRLADSVTSPLL